MQFWSIITDIGIVLTAALILGGIAIRLKMSPIIGYLLAGMCLGGSGSLPLLKSTTEVEAIAELGVSLLLFSMGLEFSWQKLKKFPRSTVTTGILQIVLTPIVIYGVTTMMGLDYRLSVLIALMLTLSSTATVLRTLTDLTEVDSVYGRYSTAILLIQDVAVVPFTIIVSLVCTKNTGLTFSLDGLILTLAGAVGLVCGLYLLINKVADPALRMFSQENNREMGILMAMIFSIGSAWVAHRIGLSPATGAFIAGMLLGNSKFATQIRADVAPLKILFMTLFFGSVGMVANPIWIASNLVQVISITAAVMAFKTIVTIAIFRFSCNSFSIAVASGLCLSQIGEFAFVLSSIAYKAHVLPDDLYQLMVSVIIFSIFTTPFIVKAAPIIGLKLERYFFKKVSTLSPVADNHPIDNLVFILGFGPAAREIVSQLKKLDLRIVVIDLNQDSINKAKEMGLEAHIGDIRQIEVLKAYKVQRAKLVVVTVPGHAAAIQAINNARRLAPHIKVIARSRYHENVHSLVDAGAHEVVNEERSVGEELAKSVKEMLNE